MENSINICNKAANASNEFERNTSELKRRYLVHNIMLYNHIITKINGNCGSFGTGYPFYVLDENLTGQLPVIAEQIRYNNELISFAQNSGHTNWFCFNCLLQNSNTMPDLKQICKPCPNMEDELKPRKILNRLPDIDMWMIYKDSHFDDVKEELTRLFREYNFHTSDVNPIQTIEDLTIITQDLERGIMPEKRLPLDAHIIDYQTISSLIEQVPFVLKQASIDSKTPYLPIHPLSYRKTWQYDDTAYNFIYDYLQSFTDFNFDENLKQLLIETRNIIAKSYSFEQLYQFLIASGPASAKNRYKTLALKQNFKERIDSWKQ